MPVPGRGEEGVGAVVGRRVEGVVLVGVRDADDAAVAGGEGGGGGAVVAGRGDDDDVVGPGVVDGRLEGRRVAGVAEGHVDDVGAMVGAQTTPAMMSLSWPRPSASRTVTGMTLTPA